MILARAPLRVSIGGGGTDVPAYYQEHGTVFSSMAIDKYIYVGCNVRFYNEIFLRYSKNELIGSVKEVQHPIIRQTLESYIPDRTDIEITSMADVPAGTGLGSSGSFGVALQLVLRKFTNRKITKKLLAERSTEVEMVDLGRPIGLQDQYISSYGGLTEFTVNPNGAVQADTKYVSKNVNRLISDNLMLIYVGGLRDSSSLLLSQREAILRARHTDDSIFQDIVRMGQDCLQCLLENDLESYGSIMHQYWLIKRERQKNQTSNAVATLYDHLFDNELIFGGKLVGAGGGGFLLVATSKKDAVHKFLTKHRMRYVDFSLDTEGATLLVE